MEAEEEWSYCRRGGEAAPASPGAARTQEAPDAQRWEQKDEATVKRRRMLHRRDRRGARLLARKGRRDGDLLTAAQGGQPGSNEVRLQSSGKISQSP